MTDGSSHKESIPTQLFRSMTLDNGRSLQALPMYLLAIAVEAERLRQMISNRRIKRRDKSMAESP